MNTKNYTVSKDIKNGLWYVHQKGYEHIPISGSFSERKSEAAEYAKMYNLLPNKVEKIERERHEKWMSELQGV